MKSNHSSHILLIFSFIIMNSSNVFSQYSNKNSLVDAKLKSNSSRSKNSMEFNHLEKAIKNDKLTKIIKREQRKINKVLVGKKKTFKNFYNFPTENEFWSFYNEYWLIKNETILKWNFERADYKLILFMEKFLKSFGLIDRKFKVLLLNTPAVYYAVLPTTSNEYIFLLSRPFIKAMDLSKQEISLIFLQEILRNNKGITFSYFNKIKIQSFYGSNFYKKEFPISKIKNILSIFDNLYIKKGFTFEDQFKVTKEMDLYLKSDLNIWNSYLNLLKKIDQLVKSNVLFRDYIKKFPSPELQINWFTEPYKSKKSYK